MLTAGRSAVAYESGRAWQVGIHFRAGHVFIGEMKVSKLKRNPSNPRQISKEKLEKLKASVGGFQKMMELRPLVVDESFTVLGGNMRLAAIKALGLKDIPDSWIKQASDLTPDEKAQFIITDNSSFGEYDWDEIANGWTDYPLSDWGLDVPNIETIEPQEPLDAEPQIDKAAELNKKWKVKTGDLWQIGEHRLICGDSCDAGAVVRLMDGETAALMNTDPPYGIAYVQNAKSKDQAEAFEDIANDEVDGEKLQAFLEDAIRAAIPHLTPNAAFYFWHPMLTQGTFFAAAAAADILIHRQIIWIKPSLVFGRGDYHWQHELAFYGWVRGNRPPFYGERNQTTFWAMGRENDNVHPTQKPVELFVRPIHNHTKKGEIVYEPFAGSGSQLVAAQNTDRRCFAMELEADYCAVILERMQTAFPDIEIKRIENAKSKATN
jgi:DNA modification methylase